MANKYFSAITTSWIAITDLITPEDGKAITYVYDL